VIKKELQFHIRNLEFGNLEIWKFGIWKFGIWKGNLKCDKERLTIPYLEFGNLKIIGIWKFGIWNLERKFEM